MGARSDRAAPASGRELDRDPGRRCRQPVDLSRREQVGVHARVLRRNPHPQSRFSHLRDPSSRRPTGEPHSGSPFRIDASALTRRHRRSQRTSRESPTRRPARACFRLPLRSSVPARTARADRRKQARPRAGEGTGATAAAGRSARSVDHGVLSSSSILMLPFRSASSLSGFRFAHPGVPSSGKSVFRDDDLQQFDQLTAD
jgi:hypothetical protein